MAYTAIDNPELYFQAKLYTGTGTSTAFTLDGDEDMQPDLVWIKARDDAESHKLYDAVRGTTKHIESDTSDVEGTEAGGLTAFGSDGFTVGDYSSINNTDGLYVAWCWKANGSGSANTDGSINTTATSANTTAGFSINQWDGSDADGTLGHGLNVAPRCILIKNQDATEQWYVYHESMGNGNRMVLNDNSAQSSAANWWQDTSPTTSVIYLSGVDGINGNNDMINYCWHEVQGFSKFGSYEGNGNADGPFVYLGFRPAYVMYKPVDATDNWEIHDNKRDTINPMETLLYANLNNAEGGPSGVTDRLDFLSNGFKILDSGGHINTSGNTYIYMAFAEAPFVNSNGVPCNAR